MSKNKDKALDYIKSHSHLEETEGYEKFTATGQYAGKEKHGAIRKQTYLDLFREYAEKEKGEFRRKPLHEVKHQVKERKIRQKAQQHGYAPDTKLDFTDKQHIKLKAPKLQGYRGDTNDMLKVNFGIATDSYSIGKNSRGQNMDFGFMMKNQDINNFQSFINSTMNQAKKYYSRLSKMYKKDGEKNAEINRTLERIDKIKNELKGKRNRPVGEVIEICQDNGFIFKGIDHVIYADSSEEE